MGNRLNNNLNSKNAILPEETIHRLAKFIVVKRLGFNSVLISYNCLQNNILMMDNTSRHNLN